MKLANCDSRERDRKDWQSTSLLFHLPRAARHREMKESFFYNLIPTRSCNRYQQNRERHNRELTKCLALQKVSGEIFKEPFIDVFLTDYEQTAFSLLEKVQHNSFYFHVQKREDEKTESGITLPSNADSTLSPGTQGRQSKISQVNLSQTSLPAQGGGGKEIGSNSPERGVSSRHSKGRDPTDNQARLSVKIGDYLHSGDVVGESWGRPLVVGASGKVIRISQSQIVLQRTQPVLYYSQAHVHVQHGEWVKRNTPILTLTHQTLVTGDIIQGIPRIEQLFEAAHSPPAGMKERNHLYETLHSQVREIFRQNWAKVALPAAVRQSLQQIQQILVESIQKVYLLQGVLIADKHIEIVVRQMTCKAQVLDSGDTGLLLEELLPVQHLENANLSTPGKKALYAPVVVGLTRSALESDSFLSAASFQETTRVLSRDALIGKSDFVRGLKEKVVIGDLISAGTGLDVYFAYTLLSPTQSGSDAQIKTDDSQ